MGMTGPARHDPAPPCAVSQVPVVRPSTTPGDPNTFKGRAVDDPKVSQVVRYAGAKGDLVWSVPECYDCSGCIAVCPYDAMSIHAGIVAADMDRCTLCTLCARACPTGAIAIERNQRVKG